MLDFIGRQGPWPKWSGTFIFWKERSYEIPQTTHPPISNNQLRCQPYGLRIARAKSARENSSLKKQSKKSNSASANDNNERANSQASSQSSQANVITTPEVLQRWLHTQCQLIPIFTMPPQLMVASWLLVMIYLINRQSSTMMAPSPGQMARPNHIARLRQQPIMVVQALSIQPINYFPGNKSIIKRFLAIKKLARDLFRILPLLDQFIA